MALVARGAALVARVVSLPCCIGMRSARFTSHSALGKL